MKQIVSVKRMSINKVAESISAILSHFTIFTYLTNTDCDDTICLLKKRDGKHMSKASMDNKRVKFQITEGLFSLLRKKAFSEITVTEIVTESRVARASYYRNFDNKEQIIEAYMDCLRDELMSGISYDDDEHIFNQENARIGFEKALIYCLIRKADLLALYHNGFGSLIQQTFNRYIMEFAGNMSIHSVERYKLYFISGAVTNVLIEWLNEGAKEPPKEIAALCVNYFTGGILHNNSIR